MRFRQFVLNRVLNQKQKAIFEAIRQNGYSCKTEASRLIARKLGWAVSTVKYNYGVLEGAGLVSRGRLTKIGRSFYEEFWGGENG